MKDIITAFHPRHSIEKYVANIYNVFNECILCEKQVYSQSDSYYCCSCDFYFHMNCVVTLMESFLTINHPEMHEHMLTFIRKKNSFNCDACGKVDEHKMNMYGCLSCDFFIHRNCIYLPKVIKITRHSHCLFHTLQLPDGNTMNCRICNGNLVRGYGGYICIEKSCVYKVHSYCATDSNVWDGKDLKGVPEEVSNYEYVPSLWMVKIDGKNIRHFSHGHDLMRLCVDDIQDGGRICQACILPIDFNSFFGCNECDFSLHDICARLPRKMAHTLHRHPLTLHVDMMKIDEGFFTCSICNRESCGFMYLCCQEDCGFKMDATCASCVEPFYHVAHQHPLTLSQSYGYSYICSICLLPTRTFATCYLCSNICWDFKCATLPVSVKCKYDIHPLTLCLSLCSYYSAPWSHLSLMPVLPALPLCCDICENKIDQKPLFYICYDCNTTIHVDCLIGKYPYLKPGHKIKVNGFEIEIASNTLSRPICLTCHCISQDKLVFINRSNGVCFCSINCIISSTKASVMSC